MAKLLSIIIITCNRKEELILAIESCRLHTQRSFELVIVDNNSSDGTESLVQAYCKENLIDLKYVFLNENTGVSYARNIGFREANGDILFFIDDDAVVISDGNSLDLVADYMRDNNIMSCVGSSLDYRFGGELSFIKCLSDKKDNYYQVRSYVGFNHFISKSFTDRNYLYPDNLFYGSEELYVGLTVLKNNGKTIFIKQHVVQHNPSLNTRIDRTTGIMNGYVNTYVIKKYFLSGFFRLLSSILFYCRILKFAKFDINLIKKCHRLAIDRYDPRFDNQISNKKIIKCIKDFGVTAIL